MTRLYVGSLPFSFDDDKLRAEFESFGTITDTKVIVDRDSGKSKGFGFVTFETEEDAKKAVDEMNDKEVEGRRIKVDVSRPREGGERRGGFRGGDRGDRGDRRDGGDRRGGYERRDRKPRNDDE